MSERSAQFETKRRILKRAFSENRGHDAILLILWRTAAQRSVSKYEEAGFHQFKWQHYTTTRIETAEKLASSLTRDERETLKVIPKSTHGMLSQAMN